MEVGDNALFPLLHFVLDDLPTSTKAPALDDRNTRQLLTLASGGDAAVTSTVTEELMGLYFAWLVAAEFLPEPVEAAKAAKKLPELKNKEGIKAAGRTGV
jgi:L-2-aminoadipate reductase